MTHTADKITSVPLKDTTLPFHILTSPANYTAVPALSCVKLKQNQGQYERACGRGMGLGGGVYGQCIRALWDTAPT